MASVRKRTWKTSKGETKTAYVADYFDQSGQRHIKTFDRQKDARAWLPTTQHEVKQGTHTPERDSKTIAEAGALWLERGALEGLERSTLDKYWNHLDLHIKPLIGALKLAHLSAPRGEQFRDDLLAKLSRPMAKKGLGSLKSIVADAQRRRVVAQHA